jgi:cell division protein FtsW
MSLVKNEKRVDTFFLGIVIALVVFGLLMFLSASFGVLAKDQAKFSGILFNQIALGLIGGMGAMWVAYKIPYEFWRKYAFYIFLFGIFLTALVFVPGLGLTHGGATRWLDLGPVSFQPVEFLKIAFIIYFSAWIAWVKPKGKDHGKKIVVPFLVLLGIVTAILVQQPDTKSLILIMTTGLAMLFVSKIPFKYIAGLVVVGLIGFGMMIAFKPYILERVLTFVDPSRDPSGASFQLNQAQIALGAGGTWGRGLGQSIQKFTYLPEPQGDSIFAVIGEELGFVGTFSTIILYVLFALRGLRIASRSPDMFSRLLVTGLVILLTAQSFLNIASIVGVFPLTGVPLVFVSHGGTSLMLALFSVGLILNISKRQLSLN